MILIILLILVSFPIAVNLVRLIKPREVKIALYFGRPRTSLLIREDLRLFSDANVDTVRGLKGVISVRRSMELWLKEGKIVGLEFDNAGFEHLPPLISGRYPRVNETQAAVLSNDTATKLGVGIGSQFSVLGEEFSVVGLTVRHEVLSPDEVSFVSEEYDGVNWIPIFTAFIPYETLVRLEDNYGDPGDAANYGVTQSLFEPGAWDTEIVVVADSYDHALWLMDEVPLRIKETRCFAPQAHDLKMSRNAPLYQALFGAIYMASFVAFGVIGLPNILKKENRDVDFWITLILVIFGLCILYLFSFPYSDLFEWFGHSLSHYGNLYFPVASTLISIACISSLRRGILPNAIFEGFVALLGWTLVISMRLPSNSPFLPFLAVINIPTLFAYPIAPALIGTVRGNRLQHLKI
ncbi:MAG: hypothetical protein ACE5Z5_01865 [Candidatus Bathyarchaeia archaeon]